MIQNGQVKAGIQWLETRLSKTEITARRTRPWPIIICVPAI